MLLKLCGRYGVHESPQLCVATMASMCPLPCAVLMVSMCHSNCLLPMASMRRSLGILGIHGLDTMETNGSMESKEIKRSKSKAAKSRFLGAKSKAVQILGSSCSRNSFFLHTFGSQCSVLGADVGMLLNVLGPTWAPCKASWGRLR